MCGLTIQVALPLFFRARAKRERDFAMGAGVYGTLPPALN
jgi:hypothetical protein